MSAEVSPDVTRVTAQTRRRGRLHWVNRETRIALCGKRVTQKDDQSPADRIRAMGEREVCPTCEVAYLELMLR